MRLYSSLLVTFLLFSGCGDDDTSTDAGAADVTSVDAQSDADPEDGGTVDGGNDAGSTDGGAADGGNDAGVDIPVCGEGVVGTCCFDVSETIDDLPFVIPDTFDESTPTWNRPTDNCPSEALSDDAVPFVAYTYCNKSNVATDFQFEVGGDEDPIANAVIVAYSGTEINADPAMCGAYNEPLLGQAELVLTLAPGEVVTIVSTTRDSGDYGGLQSIAGEPTE